MDLPPPPAFEIPGAPSQPPKRPLFSRLDPLLLLVDRLFEALEQKRPPVPEGVRRWLLPSGMGLALIGLVPLTVGLHRAYTVGPVFGAAQDGEPLPAGTVGLALLKDGSVLLTNREMDLRGSHQQALVLDPKLGRATARGEVLMRFSGSTLTPLMDGRVLVTGGYDLGGENMGEVYDSAQRRFFRTGSPEHFLDSHTATLLPDGRVLIVTSYFTYFFNPDTLTFQSAAPLLHSRDKGSHAAVLLADGTVLVVGGEAEPRAERFDPRRNEWREAGELTWARSSPNLLRLKDGRVLVTGSCSEATREEKGFELYDPGTERFELILGTPSSADHPVLLQDGSVLFADEPSRRFDPVSRSLRLTGGMVQPRWGHSTLPLADGRVIIAGGYRKDWNSKDPSMPVECFDPGTNSYRLLSPR